jgi:hypothetical protein
VEICISIWAISGYTGSFYFWLDILGSLSLIPDIVELFVDSASSDEVDRFVLLIVYSV